MKLQDLLKDIELGKVYTDKDRKPFKVNEDGHTDVPSAIRKLKLSIEDSEELLKKLESMDKESSLPAWWTDKITLASNYLNKSRDYLLNSELSEEKLNERLKRFKVYVSGQSEPLTLLGKDVKSVKQLAYQMIQNSSVRVKKVVKEGLDESDMDRPQGFSSPEAKKVIDSELKDWAKDLRKVQGRVVKTWMSKAKSGVIDYFDLIRGLTTGDARRAHPYETKFLMSLLNKDKIINRFRSYFGGKKGKASRTK